MKFVYDDNRIFKNDENGNLLAEVTFPPVDENTVNINHTFVDDSLRGQGIAGVLMEETYKYVKTRNLKVICTCPYAVNWYEKNLDKQDILRK